MYYLKAIIICTLLYITVVACTDFPGNKLNIRRQGLIDNFNRKRDAQGQCIKFVCATGGQSCANNATTGTIATCTQDGFSYCEPTTQICSAPLPNGRNCTSNNDCQSGNCRSSDEICAEKSQSGRYGLTCATDNDCDGYKCSSGRCNYRAVNEVCTADDFCEPRYYCGNNANNRVCSVRKAKDATCDFEFGDEQCEYSLLCTPATVSSTTILTATCQLEFSLSAGAACDADTSCKPDLACLRTNAGDEFGTCVTAVTSSKKSCNNNTDCNAHEECSCNFGTGNQVCVSTIPPAAKDSTSSAKDFYDCFKSKCQDYKDSCLEKQCKKQQCSYYNSQVSDDRVGLEESYPICYVNYVFADSELEFCASSGASVVGFSLSLIISFLLFVVIAAICILIL